MQKSPADRVKAAKLRAMLDRGDDLTEDQQAFLDHYDNTKTQPNRSASRKVVHIEEEAAAEGDHPHPEAYAAVARAEGLRADTLFRLQSEAWVAVNAQFMQLLTFITQRSLKLEEAHIGLLEAVRDSFLSKTKTEAEMMKLQALADLQGDGDDDQFIEMLKLLGVARAAAGQATPGEKKGAKKRKRNKPMGVVDPG